MRIDDEEGSEDRPSTHADDTKCGIARALVRLSDSVEEDLVGKEQKEEPSVVLAYPNRPALFAKEDEESTGPTERDEESRQVESGVYRLKERGRLECTCEEEEDENRFKREKVGDTCNESGPMGMIQSSPRISDGTPSTAGSPFPSPPAIFRHIP